MAGSDGHKTPEGRLFVGGHWRDEREWLLAPTVSTPYSLHRGGSLSTDTPSDQPPITHSIDPRNPVPTLGGNVSSQGKLMVHGATGQRCPLIIPKPPPNAVASFILVQGVLIFGLTRLRGVPHSAARGKSSSASVAAPMKSDNSVLLSLSTTQVAAAQ